MNLDGIKRACKRLTDPSLSAAELDELYSELRAVNEAFRAEVRRRREAPVRFSNGLELPAWKVAAYCNRYSIADFCIRNGLDRAEVLERTGLGRAGVR